MATALALTHALDSAPAPAPDPASAPGPTSSPCPIPDVLHVASRFLNHSASHFFIQTFSPPHLSYT